MKKMMTYSEANTILGSSLTPNNRCICKKTARDNHADPAPLASFTDNRLVPVDYVNLVEYDITFKYDNNTTWKTERYAYGATPTPGTPSLPGQIFDGWSPTITAVTAPATYVATWHAETVYYTVTFMSEGSQYGQTQSVASGGYATAPSTDPTKPGYTFAGWSIDGTNVVSVGSTPITGNTTFTAVFTENAPVGPSTTGILVVQGGYDGAIPWNLDLTDDFAPASITLYPHPSDQTPINGTITVTGYKYNFRTKTRTDLPSGCYISFLNVCHSISNYYSTGTTITLSDPLYNQGWRLEETEAGEGGTQDNTWGDTTLKTKTYHYTGAGICQIGVPGGTPEELWFVTLSTEDATLTSYYNSYIVEHAPSTTVNGTTYSTYFITNSCWTDQRTTHGIYSYLDDSNLPATSTGWADRTGGDISVLIWPN